MVVVVPFRSFPDSSHTALLRDTCSERRAPCILLNLPLRLAAVGCTPQKTSETKINKQLQLLFSKTLPLELRHSDVIVL